MQKVEQNFNPELALIGLSATRPKTKTFYTPSCRTKRFHNLNEFEMVNCFRQNSKIDFSACNKTGDESRQHCCPPFSTSKFSFKRLDPGLWRNDFKSIRFQSSTQIHQTRQIQKIQVSVSVCRYHQAESCKKVCAFKGTGFLVDGARVAHCMLLTNCVVLHRKDRASPGKSNKPLFRLRFEWLKTCGMRLLSREWCKSTCMTSYSTVFH